MSDQTWIVPLVLEGDWVRLEPLDIHHAEDLANAAVEQSFRFFAGFLPEPGNVAVAEHYIRKVQTTLNKVAFATVERSTGRAIGSTSFMDIRETDRGLEIGSTWLTPAAQGTAANPESKLLLLTHAFEKLGAIRVQFKTDSRNLQSRAALEKLGAQKEGVLRNQMIMRDGYLRDSVYYSIVPDEWPAVKARLIERLKGLEDRGILE